MGHGLRRANNMSKSVNDLEIYREAMRLAEVVWEVAIRWDFFAKDTVGKQLVRAVDSIGANLAEGHGRYHYKENRNFCYFSRGSLTETQTWLEKAARRSLIEADPARQLYQDLDTLRKRLNAYIQSLGPRDDE
jgi:four helix bundle protein